MEPHSIHNWNIREVNGCKGLKDPRDTVSIIFVRKLEVMMPRILSLVDKGAVKRGRHSYQQPVWYENPSGVVIRGLAASWGG